MRARRYKRILKFKKKKLKKNLFSILYTANVIINAPRDLPKQLLWSHFRYSETKTTTKISIKTTFRQWSFSRRRERYADSRIVRALLLSTHLYVPTRMVRSNASPTRYSLPNVNDCSFRSVLSSKPQYARHNWLFDYGILFVYRIHSSLFGFLSWLSSVGRRSRTASPSIARYRTVTRTRLTIFRVLKTRNAVNRFRGLRRRVPHELHLVHAIHVVIVFIRVRNNAGTRQERVCTTFRVLSRFDMRTPVKRTRSWLASQYYNARVNGDG